MAPPSRPEYWPSPRVEIEHVGEMRRRRAVASMRICSRRSGVAITCRVTLRPIILIGMPLVKTTCAASGSHQMLNSAAGVTLPKVSEPPMSAICLMRCGSVGSLKSAEATFVSGPIGTRCRSSTSCERSMMKSTVLSSTATVGEGRLGPSSPDSP